MAPQKIAAIVLLVTLMLHTGLQVNRAHLIAVLKDYGLLSRAALANFIVVPLVALALVRALHVVEPIADGILLMAICPGVPFVVMAGGRKKGGSLGLAVSLAFLLPLASVITVPVTARLVFPAGTEIAMKSMIVSLVLFQLLPLLVGMFVAERSPEAAERAGKPLVIVLIAAVVALFVVLGKDIVASIASVYGSLGIITIALIVVLSLVAGWTAGWKEREYRRTLAVGTGLRNIGLAAVAATAFNDRAVAAAVLTYLVVQVVLVAIAGVYFTRTAGSSDVVVAR